MDGNTSLQSYRPEKPTRSVLGSVRRDASNRKSHKLRHVMQDRNGGKLRITLNFRRQSDNRPVVFKFDGERFHQPQTVKFNQDEAYDVSVILEPPVAVDSFLLHEERVALEEVGKKDKYVLTDSNVAYSGKWTPRSFDRTRRNHRESLKIVINLKNYGTVLTILQSKFYANCENHHSQWGEPLNAIIYECQVSSFDTVTIQQQQLI